MKIKNTLLFPPIEIIEANLFAPSAELMQRWLDGKISAEEEQLLKEHPIAQGYKNNLTNVLEASLTADVDMDSTPKMPDRLSNMVERHLQAKEKFQSVSTFNVGQIRMISSLPEQLTLPDKKLAVMLIEEIATPTGKVWRGFMTASETAWAGWWDLILEEVDQPIDPCVGMIQVWNTVYVTEKNLSQVVGQISSERLAAVKALKDEYLFGPETDVNLSAPGKILVRATSQDFMVTTGTPLTTDDERLHFQSLYHTVSKLLSVPLVETVEEFEFVSILERLVIQIKSVVEQVGSSLIPIPDVAYAMGDVQEKLETKTVLINNNLTLKNHSIG